ncbi:MAG: GTP 3',8-cyclase MoaA [Betaproteobacteria bacterium]|nr:GTP 3',8-cyclase MoaA [Betaproteobacteria bacterium]MCL2162512.1 GTP 3',8-cyclase MoaA [Betaproteobacteria bacterium]
MHDHTGEPCLDNFQRPLHDLRISVTDRCNLRCMYCMPGEVFGRDFVFLRHAELLSFEEIVRVARQCVALGVRKIRLSGGEPMLRHGIERLVEMLAGLHDDDGKPIELAMTSNGTLLAKKARALKDAGLMRLNISLDALDESIFRRMTGGGSAPEIVLEGIAAAQSVGLTPVKVNAVIKRGVNESEILPLVRRFRHTGVIMRFIEYMDVGNTNGWRLDDVVTAREILALIDREHPLAPIAPSTEGEGVAERWALRDGSGEIGVITSVTQAFCHTCNRLRLSTDGKLYTCLFATEGVDLRALLRDPSGDDATLRQRIAAAWRCRTDRYSQLRHEMTETLPGRIEMSYIGG